MDEGELIENGITGQTVVRQIGGGRGCKLIVDCPIKERNFIGDRVRAEGKGLGIISLGVLVRIDSEWYPDEKDIYRERKDYRNQIESLMDGPTLKVSLLPDFRTLEIGL